MFGIGFGELIIIFVIALLVVGPQKLPEMAKSLARVLKEVRKTSDEFQASFLRDTGSDVQGLLSNPKDTIKRHLENEVKEVLQGTEDPEQTLSIEHEGDLPDKNDQTVSAEAPMSPEPLEWQPPEKTPSEIDDEACVDAKKGSKSIG